MLERIVGTHFLLCLYLVQEAVCRQCYNYQNDATNRVIECEHGCCGPDHEQYCCDITLQIIGSVIGGLLLLAIVVGGIYYCCRQTSTKRQMDSRGGGVGGGILARLGMRPNHRVNARQNEQRPQPHRVPPHPARVNVPYGHYNPAYVNAVNIRRDQSSLLMTNRVLGPPHVIPTAPPPPPYALTMSPPPPYQPDKSEIPMPPVYDPPTSIACRLGTPNRKLDDFSDTMPPASS